MQPEVLQGLESDIKYFKILIKKFLSVWRSQLKKIKIFYFYKQKTNPINRIVGEGLTRIVNLYIFLFRFKLTVI